MIWGDGVNANPGALQAKAAELMAAHTNLTAIQTAHDSTELGPWRGEAARAERDRHRTISAALDRQLASIPKAADALNDAAATLTGLQRTQHSAISRAASWQYRYNDWGVVRSTVDGINLDPRRPFIRGDLQRIGISVTTRLNACDLELAAKLGRLVVTETLSEFGDDLKNGLITAGEWAGDQIMNGLEWSRDRIVDGYEWGQDRVEDVIGWFNDGLDAAQPAWERLRETLGTSPRWLTDLIDKGEVPQIAEVLGAAAFVAGQGAGVAWNFLSGEDKHFFDDGTPWSGDPTPHRQTNYTGVHDVMTTAMDMYATHDPDDPDDRASVQVTAVVGDGGTVRYIAAIPGSTEGMGAGGWFGRNSGMDWAANLRGVGFGDTAATHGAMDAINKAIEEDMARRGLEGRPELLLTGHSQGGILAANMAADEEFMSRYDVKGIISAGSPQQTIPVPEGVQVYNFANEYDPVPAVDFNGRNVDLSVNEQPNVHTIVIPHSGSYLPTHTHEQSYYLEGIRDLQDGGGTAEQQAMMAQMNDQLGGFFGDTDGAYRVQYGRETTP